MSSFERQRKNWTKIPYPRTAKWWTSGGDWHKISTWMRHHVGSSDEWDYMNETIYIKDPAKAVWFKLAWT